MPRRHHVIARKGTTAQWLAANPILKAGELGAETDTGIIKCGDGTRTWTTLPNGASANEDVAFGATEMNRGAATLLTTNQIPRIEMLPAVTTNVQVGGFNFPDWYLIHGVDMHIVWANEGAGAQTPTFAWNLRQVNIGQAMSAGTLISSSFAAPPNLGNGVVSVNIIAPTITITPGAFGYILGLEIARLGGSDSLANAISLIAVGFTRKTA